MIKLKNHKYQANSLIYWREIWAVIIFGCMTQSQYWFSCPVIYIVIRGDKSAGGERVAAVPGEDPNKWYHHIIKCNIWYKFVVKSHCIFMDNIKIHQNTLKVYVWNMKNTLEQSSSSHTYYKHKHVYYWLKQKIQIYL